MSFFEAAKESVNARGMNIVHRYDTTTVHYVVVYYIANFSHRFNERLDIPSAALSLFLSLYLSLCFSLYIYIYLFPSLPVRPFPLVYIRATCHFKTRVYQSYNHTRFNVVTVAVAVVIAVPRCRYCATVTAATNTSIV